MSSVQQLWFDFGPPLVAGAADQTTASGGGAAIRPGAGATADGDVILRRSFKASRYRLSVSRDGRAVLTIPSRGSERLARRFLESQRAWLERARQRMARQPRSAEIWTPGTRVLLRGEWRLITRALDATPHVMLGAERFRVRRFEGDLRPVLEAHFRRLARIELPARTWELAAVTGVEVRGVTIRNQQTRWGSCSSNGTISLNWRLVQTPGFVADYIVLHELMHRREMNHSRRFWSHVAVECPQWEEAERWLEHHGSALGL